MKNKKLNLYNLIIPTIIFFFNAIMIIFPKEIFEGAKVGLLLWFNKVIPTLMPFMITCNILTALNFPQLLGKALTPLTSKLFRLYGCQSFPLVVGLTAGYPMGVKTTAQLYKQGKIPRATANRLLMYCNNAGALFILGTVGTVFFDNPKAGYYIMFCNYTSAILLAIITAFFCRTNNTVPSVDNKPYTVAFSQKILADAINGSICSILSIGGYIILFSVLNEVFVKLHIIDGLSAMLSPLGMEKEINNGIAMGIFEITNGCNLISSVKNKTALLCATAVIGWGGFSIHAQSLEFISDTDLSVLWYFVGKIANSILSLAMGLIFWKLFFR